MRKPQKVGKLSPLAILLELEDETSSYDKRLLKASLKERGLSREQLTKYLTQRDHVLQMRKRKAEEPLSLWFKARLLITPFGLSKRPMHLDQSRLETDEQFLKNAGYDRKMTEIKKYRKLSIKIWIIVQVALLLYIMLR